MKQFLKVFNQASILAPARDQRPFISKNHRHCPFCPQNKHYLEHVILEKWQGQEFLAKVIRNKYPIVDDHSGKGFHDVVIDTEDHEIRPADFTLTHWEGLLGTLWVRWHQLMQQSKITFIQVFKNEGKDAGASISHSHWQILALEEIPLTMKKQYMTYNHDGEGPCYLCQLIEGKEGFLIFEDEFWRAWVPPMPEFNGEVWLIPKRHCQHYGQLHEMEIKNLGRLMKAVLMAYAKMKPGIAYNICFMSGDLQEKWPYHFHVKIVMRTGNFAGFELATRCHVLTQSPESYAHELYINIKGMYK